MIRICVQTRLLRIVCRKILLNVVVVVRSTIQQGIITTTTTIQSAVELMTN